MDPLKTHVLTAEQRASVEQTLERVLRDRNAQSLSAVHQAIARKIGREDGTGDERAFLDAYYTQLRARLEASMRMGRRKADKYG